MPIIQYCPFCENLGFKSPHDHTIRDFTKHDNPITCPRLLQCECKYCHNIGHTKNYCPRIKKKRLRETNNDLGIFNDTINANHDKRKRENPFEFIDNKNKREKNDNKFASLFASLVMDVDSEIESSYFNSYNECKKTNKHKLDSCNECEKASKRKLHLI